MKKLFVALLTVLLLAGCSGNKTTSPSDENSIVLKIGDKEITKKILYETMLYNYGTNTVFLEATEMVLAQRAILTDEDTAKMEEDFAQLKETYGEDFNFWLLYYGYVSEEDYYENAFVPSYRQKVLADIYIRENLSAVAFDYQPYKVNYAFIMQNEELANEIAAALQGGATFEELSVTYANEVAVDIKVGALLYKEMNYNATAYEAIYAFAATEKNVGTYYDVEYDSLTDAYYVVEIVASNVEDFEDDFVDSLSSSDSNILSKAVKYYFAQDKFTIYDKWIYDTFVEVYGDYLGK
jgi:hypothetical protein